MDIDVDELFNKYESNDKEANQLLLFIRTECREYNKMLKLVKTDIANVVACKYGDTNFDVDDVKQALVHNIVPKRWRKYYTNKNLLEWTKNLASRINFMRDTLSDLSQVKS